MKLIKNIFLITCFIGVMLNMTAEVDKRPPLAPPSTLALSFEDMILHFKIFVLADYYEKILFKNREKNIRNFINLSDLELKILLQDKIEKSSLLSATENLKISIENQIMLVEINDIFFRCFTLEVLPGNFETKIEPLKDKKQS